MHERQPDPAVQATELDLARTVSGPKRFPAVNESGLRKAFEAGRHPHVRLLGRATYAVEKAWLQANL